MKEKIRNWYFIFLLFLIFLIIVFVVKTTSKNKIVKSKNSDIFNETKKIDCSIKSNTSNLSERSKLSLLIQYIMLICLNF